MSKKETVEEFLARGGKITQCPAAPSPSDEEQRTNPTVATNATMMTLAEGALYYAESRAKLKEPKKKEDKVLNFAALPACLLKYVPKKN